MFFALWIIEHFSRHPDDGLSLDLDKLGKPGECLIIAEMITLPLFIIFLGIVDPYLDKKRQEAENQCHNYGYDNHEFIDGKCYQVNRLGYISKENCAKIIYPTAYKHGECYELIKKVKTGQHTR